MQKKKKKTSHFDDLPCEQKRRKKIHKKLRVYVLSDVYRLLWHKAPRKINVKVRKKGKIKIGGKRGRGKRFHAKGWGGCTHVLYALAAKTIDIGSSRGTEHWSGPTGIDHRADFFLSRIQMKCKKKKKKNRGYLQKRDKKRMHAGFDSMCDQRAKLPVISTTKVVQRAGSRTKPLPPRANRNLRHKINSVALHHHDLLWFSWTYESRPGTTWGHRPFSVLAWCSRFAYHAAAS